jgi:hypothetical protein
VFYEGDRGLLLREQSKSHILKTKVKVKLSLGLTKFHAMNTYGWVEVKLHAFLSLALDGDKGSASRSAALPQGKEPPVPTG